MLKVGFLTLHNPHDRNSFSGTTYYMFNALKNQKNVDVKLLANEYFENKFFYGTTQIVKKLTRRFPPLTKFLNNMEFKTISYFSKKINNEKLDVVIAPVSSSLVAQLPESTPPIISVTDAIPHYIEEHYNFKPSVEDFDIEEKAISISHKVVYSSEFMTNLARENYHHLLQKGGSKFASVTFGLNMDNSPETVAPKNIDSGLKLLFVGKDWERKGGDIAVEAHLELLKQGINSTLYIVGCNPAEVQNLANVEVIPYLNKNIESQQAKYYDLLTSAHFLLLPTRGDCTPMVIAEANAFGAPVLSSNISGIPSLIDDSKNGFLFDPESTGTDYANTIKKVYSAPDSYQQLSKASRLAFEQKLNWKVWAEKVIEIGKELT